MTEDKKKLVCEVTRQYSEQEHDTMQCSMVVNNNAVEEFSSLPVHHYLFNGSTINNLSSIEGRVLKDKHDTIEKTYTPDDQSEINCETEHEPEETIRCRVDGPRIPEHYPKTWFFLAGLPSIREPDEDKKEKLLGLHQEILNESFPDYKEELDHIKPFMKDIEAEGFTLYALSSDSQLYPDLLVIASDYVNNVADSEKRKKIELVDIHELTHFVRFLEGKNEMNHIRNWVGKEEGETVTESLLRGDMKIRLHTEEPSGYIEGIIMARSCPLPSQYCFQSLKEAKNFEEYNYKQVSGEEEVRTLNPENTPNWEEIKERIPHAQAVDMLRHIHRAVGIDNVSETWVITDGPKDSGTMYSVLDSNPSDETPTKEVLDTIDELDSITDNEDFEGVQRFP